MSGEWNDGYVTGVGYTYGYYRETSPVYQRFCLLLRGFARDDPADTAAHCELGFGQGVSIAINAASNTGRFVATDFNPSHAAHARELAHAAGTDIRLYDDSFAQLLERDDLPQFDSISLHGVWTWVSPDNHRLITEFARRHLRPGGSFFVSYNCFPGWSPAHPLRQLFTSYDRYGPGQATMPKRIDAALEFSRELLAAGPLFARATTGLDLTLKSISGQNRDYLAHEYFNRDWNCLYFTEMVDALAEAKLEFAATAEPLDSVDSINLSAGAMEFLNRIEHPTLREQARDYFVNRQFRKDIFLRGSRPLSPSEQRERMLATRIVLQRVAGAIPSKVIGAQGEATINEAIFRPFIEAMAARDYAPKSLGDLLHALPEISLPQLVTAATMLVGTGNAAPCQAESEARRVRGNTERLNTHLLRRARTRDDIAFMASPVLGGGVGVGRFDQLFLLARGSGCSQPADWARLAWQVLADQGQALVKQGQVLRTREEGLAELTEQATTFANDRLPILNAVGVV